MRSSTLLALITAFSPLAVLSSPRPVEWEIEIIPFGVDKARPFRPPGWLATATTSSSGARITSGTDKDKQPVDDECENEGSSSSITTAAGANPLPTTLSTVVADKLRRQVDTIGSPPPATIAGRQADDTISTISAAGIYPPAGFAGTDYPIPTSMPAGGVAAIKKIKGNGCAKQQAVRPGSNANNGTVTYLAENYYPPSRRRVVRR